MTNRAVFEGVRVIEFCRVLAGPACTKYLADYGAEVIKIETAANPDTIRSWSPYKDGIPGVNRSTTFAMFNTGKLSVTLDLTKPAAVSLAKRLVAKADVVVENYTPSVMKKWGLSYDDLKRVNPRLIMLSVTPQGQTGPYSLQPALGIELGASAGYLSFIGRPNREIIQPFIAFPDIIAVCMGITALVGALLHRRRTGEGQYIDLSMLEASLPTLGPSLLDAQANGREPQPMGNRSLYAAPQGVYRCKGEDRWCAISVLNDGEWGGLVKGMGDPQWTSDPRFATMLGRKRNEDELDRNIENWTTHHTAAEAISLLQAYGVAAAVVQKGADLAKDPQLEHRNSYELVEGHPEIGPHYTVAPAFVLSQSKYSLRAAPCLGQDNEYVFTRILGLSDEEFIELIADEVIA